VETRNVVGDVGELTIAGPVTSFAIGGQELWLDDICVPVAPADAALGISAAGPGTASGMGTGEVAVIDIPPTAEGTVRVFSVVPHGGTASYHYEWLLDMVSVGDDSPVFHFAPPHETVAHPATESSPMTLVCVINDSASRAVATVTWQGVRVTDVSRPPNMAGVTVRVTPSPEAEDGEDLTCALTGAASDEDAEDVFSMRYRYLWRTALGTVLRDVTKVGAADVLSATATTPDRVIFCAVTAVDQAGVGSVGAVDSNTVSIVPDGELWRLPVDITGGQLGEVVIGMNSSATDGFDVGIDWLSPPPGQGVGFAALEIPGNDLARDFRPPADEAEWTLFVSAGEVPVDLAWDTASVPEHGLFMIEVDGSGEPVPGGMSRRMAHEDTLSVPADTVTCFAIHYAEILTFKLPLVDGWNMVSVPIAPLDTSVADVFKDKNTGPVWRWVDGAYAAATNVVPGEGYWVYYLASIPGEATIVEIKGRPAESSGRDLSTGWNLIGPIGLPPYNDIPVPLLATPAEAVAPPIWGWNGAQYDAALEWLQMGRGYWGYALEPCTVELGE